jgi:uncharacterized protein YdaU (DUF1376 family)
MMMKNKGVHMSDQEQKEKHSKRLQKEMNAIKRQQRIAKAHGALEHAYEGHRYAKHHAMDCGQSECMLCGNPRKIFKESSVQEKSFQQTGKWIDE